MKAFARLFEALDRTTKTSDKLAALEEYFRTTPPADAVWALHFLWGNRLKRAIRTSVLRQCVADAAGLPAWIVDECNDTVGDVAETLALLLPSPPATTNSLPLAELVRTRLLPLATATEAGQRELLQDTWSRLDTVQRFLWHKLITGNFRVGVSRGLLVRALASAAGIEPAVMAHRLTGSWQPTEETFQILLQKEQQGTEAAKPYPYFLASPLEERPDSLGAVELWQIEWKWDGIRAQLIRRNREALIWSRGEELITDVFPEIARAAAALPDGTVLDGEALAWRGDHPLPFHQLQRRLNRRSVSARDLREVPVAFMAYDVLEYGGKDLREVPLEDRRALLERLIQEANTALKSRPAAAVHSAPVQVELFSQEALMLRDSPTLEPEEEEGPCLRVSPLIHVDSWQELESTRSYSREAGAEGVMLKLKNSAYGVGRQRGAWWKWKVSPYTCDTVLIAAQPGHGRRATLFTDYTFGLWQGDELVPVAKAYSGLTDDEIDEVDSFVRRNTTGQYGPVRTVTPVLVFELAFEAVALSGRHKSGLALRFPRIARWRRDKKAAEAETVESLRRILHSAALNADPDSSTVSGAHPDPNSDSD